LLEQLQIPPVGRDDKSKNIWTANLFGSSQQLIEPIWIESDHNLFAGWRANHERGGGAAFVFLGQVADRGGIVGNVALFEHDSSLREERRYDMAGRSAGLCEDYDFRLTRVSFLHDSFFHEQLDALKLNIGAGFYSYSIANVIAAVFSSMADTEQYFSFERRTASSIAFFVTLPRTL
jgi:hypothetical protein